MTLPSGSGIEGQPSSPLNVNCPGEGESFRPGETISNPHVYFPGERKNERSLPQIYNSLTRNNSGGNIAPLQRPSSKRQSLHQSAHPLVGRPQATLSTACILITAALSACGSLSGGVFRDVHRWSRALSKLRTANWTLDGWNTWCGPGVSLIWGSRIFCPHGPDVLGISTNQQPAEPGAGRKLTPPIAEDREV